MSFNGTSEHLIDYEGDFLEGRIHDFSLFKTSKLPLNKNQRIIVDRGIKICHTTIMRWVYEYGEQIYKIWK